VKYLSNICNINVHEAKGNKILPRSVWDVEVGYINPTCIGIIELQLSLSIVDLPFWLISLLHSKAKAWDGWSPTCH